jgi:DNA mismatch endonuclease (patch repair protein)
MTDIWPPEKRSAVMARIRGRDTKPERLVRSLLHAMGYRFTVRGPRNRSLPGRPDLVLPKHRTVIFVHGCFWHGHEGCPGFRLPSSRREWWSEKIGRNRARDLRVQEELTGQGWQVVTVWACSLRTAATRELLARELAALLSASPRAVRKVIRYEVVSGPSLRVAEESP